MKYILMPCRFIPVIIFFLLAGVTGRSWAEAQDRTLVIHLRGVYDCKISVLALTDNKLFKPFIEVPGIKNGESTTITIPKGQLPGEFVIRFDYRDKETSTPYPSEKNIIMNNQDLELWVSPVYCNNADSTKFQQGERENTAFAAFGKDNGKQREKLGLLQNFLMNYDDVESKFYQQGISEYEARRTAYNRWLKERTQQDKALFVSTLYGFQYVPEILWKGSETDRINNLISHYFDGVDFSSPVIVRTAEINKWMDGYVNLYGQLSTSVTLRDSMLPLAGKTAIEQAKKGHPLVYGWMVDYFYRGYESNNIPAGTKILEPYMNDPDCLTSKRQEIARRLKGMETLLPGTKAPEIIMTDAEGKTFDLDAWEVPTGQILILFWSAGCSHCMEMIGSLYPWHQKPENLSRITVLAVSLDETAPEVAAWEKKLPDMKAWRHLRASDGIRSKVASDYFVLSTPVMVLIDTKTKKIVAMPNTVAELIRVVH